MAGLKIVVNTSLIDCQFGTAPTPFMVIEPGRPLVTKRLMGTIKDNIPFVNIIPFILCQSPKNPAYIAAKAVGAVAPCTPITNAAPWTPGSALCQYKGTPVLHESCRLTCQLAAAPMSISVTNPMQPLATVKG
jgi:hypothetical protein